MRQYGWYPAIASVVASFVTIGAAVAQPGTKTTTSSARVSVAEAWILVVEENGKQVPWQGRLYKVSPISAARTAVAQVSNSGKADPSVQCEPQERFAAEIDHPLAYAETREPQSCGTKLSFRFRKARLLAASNFDPMSIDVMNDPKEAHAAYSTVAAQAEAAKEFALWRVASDGAVASAAVTLGDRKLDKYVVRDPQQDYRLVLSNEGVEELRRFQARGKIPQTGKLDFQTQQLIVKGAGPR